MFKDVVRQLMTESDNTTHDLYRYLALAAICVGLGLNIFSVVYKAQLFDMQTFGIGTGALFAGVGIALGLKKEGDR
jgi:hypothetical protein